MSVIANRLGVVKPSASMAVSQAAKAMRAKGIDVIDLGLGEPDFPTPLHITEAAHTAALGGETLYTAAAGTEALRQAIANKFKRENGLEYQAANIVVANGAKQIIFNSLLATLEAGDDVILPAPYFVSYPEMVKLLGGNPVIANCPATSGFRLTPEILEQTITPRSKWLFLNMPGNPSGAVYSFAELQALGEVVARHPNLHVLADEIYEHIIFDNKPFVSFAKACPALLDRTLVVNGLSKSYAMTGWRVGYAAANPDLVKAMTTIQSQSCTSVAAPCQAAALAALTGPQHCIAEFRSAFERRRNLVVEGISRIKGLQLAPPEGAFYAYISCAALVGLRAPNGQSIETDLDFTNYLLNEGHVAAVAGSAYGLSPFFRISTATSDDILKKAISRIASAVGKLQHHLENP